MKSDVWRMVLAPDCTQTYPHYWEHEWHSPWTGISRIALVRTWTCPTLDAPTRRRGCKESGAAGCTSDVNVTGRAAFHVGAKRVPAPALRLFQPFSYRCYRRAFGLILLHTSVCEDLDTSVGENLYENSCMISDPARI